MKLRVNTVVPTTEPVTLEEAKEYLQVDFDTDDPLLDRLISASRQYIETVCGISLVEKEIELKVRGFDAPYLLPYGPVRSVEMLTIDRADAENEGDYVYESGIELEAEYTAGYDMIPEDLRSAVLEVLKVYYDARGSAVELPVFLRHKLNMYSRNLFV
jgi:hypothetical protein